MFIGSAVRRYSKVLTKNNINPHINEFQYAVRGPIAIRANQIVRDLEKGEKYPFDEIVQLNIGNPQSLGQKPFTYNRQVMASLVTGDTESSVYSEDARARAKKYKDLIPHGAMGAYTSESAGYRFVKKEVKDFISQRDDHEANEDSIYLTNGASEGVSQLLQFAIKGPDSGVMIPIPQYPLYSALIELYGGRMVEYYLDEDEGWSLNVNELE